MRLDPADKVEKMPIDALIPYARNSRTHSDEQVAQIAASIKEWGFTTPVLVDEDGGIIAGHGRTLAARKLGMTEVPVLVAKGWTESQKRAYVIADNKLALNAGWDQELLRIELLDLGEMDFDLDLTGFTMDQIDDMRVHIEDIPLPDKVGRANEHGRLEAYLEQDIKMIRLTYQSQEYDDVYDAISAYMLDHDIRDMSTAVRAKFLDNMS